MGSNTGTVTNCFAVGSVTGGFANVGGVVGDNRGAATASNCIALNQTVTINNAFTKKNSGSTPNAGEALDRIQIGRVVGGNELFIVQPTNVPPHNVYGTTDNNYAWDGLALYSGASVFSPALDDRDGESITAAEVKTQSAWTAAGFGFGMDDPWTWTGTCLPSLHGEEIAWPDYLDN